MSAVRCDGCGYSLTAPGHLLTCCSAAQIEALARRLAAPRAYPAPAPWPDQPPAPQWGGYTWATRADIRVCEPCWDDLCQACQGGPCLCACQDERSGA